MTAPGNAFVGSIAAECRRYKAMAEAAIAQVSDEEACAPGPDGGNSIAVICWHLSGNFASRFTDFLTTDGEKPWRMREEEFAARTVTRPALLAKWEHGWGILLATLDGLADADLERTITIRGTPMRVHEALHRALGHIGYHTGQIVTLAHTLRKGAWRYLTIPPGASEAYNRNPVNERPDGHIAALGGGGTPT